MRRGGRGFVGGIAITAGGMGDGAGDDGLPPRRSAGAPVRTLIGYTRISTAEGAQVMDRQMDALREAGCERVFEDRASGNGTDRPGLVACLDHLRHGGVLDRPVPLGASVRARRGRRGSS